jgi:hypothetical protein
MFAPDSIVYLVAIEAIDDPPGRAFVPLFELALVTVDR